MNKKGEINWFPIIILAFIGIWLSGMVIMIGDSYWIKPIAADKANQYCKTIGFDQVKDFTRVGLLSENPVSIRCEYAERYTDLGVRVN